MKLFVQIVVAAGAMGLIALVQLPPIQHETSRSKTSAARAAPNEVRKFAEIQSVKEGVVPNDDEQKGKSARSWWGATLLQPN
jgi:hypothetical protein